MMRHSDLITAFDNTAPELVEVCRRAVSEGTAEPGAFLCDAAAYSQAKKLDFVEDIIGKDTHRPRIAHKTRCLDLDGWDALWSFSARDADGVATSGDVLAVKCRDTLLRSDDGAIQVLGLGLTNVVAVAMRDAVLFADRSKLDELPEALAQLQRQSKTQATEYPRYHRPWGWYESLIVGGRFQVKRIMVKPGGVLSLQSHVHRSEHWIVVGGTAEVTIGEEVSLVSENGSVYIPVGTVHRMANPGKVPMYLIEVQTGTYLGEDDIRRYEDIYSRC
ncbi:mannose-1-phosphate guanylyltransferase / mannose-6-phosphate isomerase [Roseivivax lentus]|uniref:Mannose-1-phosphate guanylyltransferase / mannose-6-phosphate isomerase n=2 Tax=Roseivivax lentus TaxID=633194 RepID=A0A1N7Q218_9RHOB|nr:mannose-1-phosphate guanylyltransferase / mannose-6-phosphate isomerase [Roseivivax lentus]